MWHPSATGVPGNREHLPLEVRKGFTEKELAFELTPRAGRGRYLVEGNPGRKVGEGCSLAGVW